MRVKLQTTKMNEVQATWLTPTDPLMKGVGEGKKGRENERLRE